jgi:hypothetical protein
MPGLRLWVQAALILCGLTFILGLAAILVEGFSAAELTGLFLNFAGILFLLSKLQLGLVRVTFVMQPDEIEDRLAQAMAAIGFTIEPHSQIGHSFTFRAALGSRLVVTKTASGIDVTGNSGSIDRLASQFGIIPHKNT